MKTILMYGLPGSGKTTVMLKLMSMFDGWERITTPFVHYRRPGMNVFGDYEPNADKPFLGTDRLSMAVQPDAIKFINHNDNVGFTNFIEGSRLFTSSFINEVKPKLVVLRCNKLLIESRFKERGSQQSEKWLASCETRLNNIIESRDYHELQNNDVWDIEKCAKQITYIANGDELYLKHKQTLF
jgi:hypothetical protein